MSILSPITPKELQEKINKTSLEFYELSQELAGIASRKGTAWLELKREHDCTNGEANKLWDATKDGSREAYLRVYLKGLEKLRGALMLEYRGNAGLL